MPKVWYYQSTTQVFPQSSPPSAAPNGWGVVAPASSQQRSRASGSDASFPYNKPPATTVTVIYGWEITTPRPLAVQPRAEGLENWPFVVPYNPTFPGWEPEAPTQSSSYSRLAGAEVPLYFQPPVVTFPAIAGWMPVSPVISALHSRPAGAEIPPYNRPPIVTPFTITGCEPVAPLVSALHSRGTGSEWWALNQPPAATKVNPLGWEAIAPFMSALHSRPSGAEMPPYNLPPLPNYPAIVGWESVAPVAMKPANQASSPWLDFVIFYVASPIPPITSRIIAATWDNADSVINASWSFTMSIQTPFSWHIGEDLTFVFTATTPTNISGWTFLFEIFDFRGGNVIFQTGNVTVQDVVNGVFGVPMTNANTTTVGRFVNWLQVRRVDSGHDTVLAEGPTYVYP